MSERERILALRARLRTIMQDIEARIAETAADPKRCPHRTVAGLCTFSYGCRNREAGCCSR